MRFLPFFPSPFFLSTVLAVVAAAIGTLPTSPPSSDTLTVQKQQEGDNEPAAPKDTIDLVGARASVDVTSLSSAPIFSPTRLPVRAAPQFPLNVAEPPVEPIQEKAVEPKPQAKPAPPEFVFLGVIITQNQTKALLKEATTAQEVWVAQGGHFIGWELVEISHSSVRLRNEGNEVAVKKAE
jgi:hypothetical protein